MSKIAEEVVDPPAFPRTGEGFGNPNYDAPGMSLRDWFAGQALSGLLGNNLDGPGGKSIEGHCEHYAGLSYRYADAMLAERLSRATQKSEGGETSAHKPGDPS